MYTPEEEASAAEWRLLFDAVTSGKVDCFESPNIPGRIYVARSNDSQGMEA